METSLEKQKRLLELFLQRWPINKISQLTLDEYIDVNNLGKLRISPAI